MARRRRRGRARTRRCSVTRSVRMSSRRCSASLPCTRGRHASTSRLTSWRSDRGASRPNASSAQCTISSTSTCPASARRAIEIGPMGASIVLELGLLDHARAQARHPRARGRSDRARRRRLPATADAVRTRPRRVSRAERLGTSRLVPDELTDVMVMLSRNRPTRGVREHGLDSAVRPGRRRPRRPHPARRARRIAGTATVAGMLALTGGIAAATHAPSTASATPSDTDSFFSSTTSGTTVTTHDRGHQRQPFVHVLGAVRVDVRADGHLEPWQLSSASARWAVTRTWSSSAVGPVSSTSRGVASRTSNDGGAGSSPTARSARSTNTQDRSSRFRPTRSNW